MKLLWDEIEIALVTNSFTGYLPGWVVVGLFLAFDVWGMVSAQDAGVAYVSHVVGGLTGITLAITLLKAEWLVPDRGEQTLLMWLGGEEPVE